MSNSNIDEEYTKSLEPLDAKDKILATIANIIIVSSLLAISIYTLNKIF